MGKTVKSMACMKRAPWVLICLLTLFLPGCSKSPSSHFYALNPLMISGQMKERPGPAPVGLVGVGPLKLAEYLDRPQIVTRGRPASLDLAEFNRWGEPLVESLPRVIAANLRYLLATENVVVFPWAPSSKVDCQVILAVERLDGALGDRVYLDAHWSLVGEGGRKVLLRKSSNLSEPVSSAAYESLVEAETRAVAALSVEIAEAIRNVAQ